MLLLSVVAVGQNEVLLSRYYQNAPAFSPSLTGVENFLDVKAGFRRQWSGFTDAPQTIYLGVYGVLKSDDKYSIKEYSLRISDPRVYNSQEPVKVKKRDAVKHGLGFYLFNEEQGPFSQLQAFGNYAFHYPINDRTYLSAGISAGIRNSKININDVTVRDPINDQVYQSYLAQGSSNTFFESNLGVSLYSSKYYISYSGMKVVQSLIAGNENISFDNTGIRHHVLAGLRLPVSETLLVMPGVFLRAEPNTPATWELNGRVRYKDMFSAGIGYRNDNTVVGMLGFIVNDMINIGYSYDANTSDIADFSNGSHEIVVGLMLFKPERILPYLF